MHRWAKQPTAGGRGGAGMEAQGGKPADSPIMVRPAEVKLEGGGRGSAIGLKRKG